MPKLNFNNNIQPEFKTEIIRCLNKFAWLIPAWVGEIYINVIGNGGEGEVASVIVRYDYRFVSLDVCAVWLNQDIEDREIQLLHEIIHMHLSLIANYARDQMNILCPVEEASKLNQTIMQELAGRHEAATQDLANCIYYSMPKKHA